MIRKSLLESQILDEISVFRRGYSHYVQQVQNTTTSILNFLSSGAVTEAQKKELIPIRKELDRCLLDVIQKSKDLIVHLDEKHLVPESKRDLPFFFTDGVVDSNRIDFISFWKIFEKLKEFYRLSKDSYRNIQSLILTANFNDHKFKSETLLSHRILPALNMIEKLRYFLERMAVILGIPDSESAINSNSRKIQPKYNPNQEYRLSSVFQEGIKRTSHEEFNPDYDSLLNSSTPQNSEPVSTTSQSSLEKDWMDSIELNSFSKKPEEVIASYKSQTHKQNHVLNTSGKLPWNSNSHYYFRYDPDKLEEERKYFQLVIAMDTHLGAEESARRQEMIRSITSKQMKKKTPQELEGEYMIFLDNFYDFCRNILLMGMGIPENLKYLFFYHIGPQHFYMIVRKFMQEANTGYIHVRSQDGKKVAKFLPSEILKKHVITYWIREILPHVGEEKNSYSALKKIIEIVEVKYKEVCQHAIKEFDALPPEIKNSKPREQIFREKMNTWMGAANIIVFKRFLKTALQ